MAFAAGNVVRLKTGGGLLTVSSVASKSDGSQDVTCKDGHGRSVGTFSSVSVKTEPDRGGPTAIAPSTIIYNLT
jgi:uncharacterized protein YodC (DUF2158 family)